MTRLAGKTRWSPPPPKASGVRRPSCSRAKVRAFIATDIDLRQSVDVQGLRNASARCARCAGDRKAGARARCGRRAVQLCGLCSRGQHSGMRRGRLAQIDRSQHHADVPHHSAPSCPACWRLAAVRSSTSPPSQQSKVCRAASPTWRRRRRDSGLRNPPHWISWPRESAATRSVREPWRLPRSMNAWRRRVTFMRRARLSSRDSRWGGSALLKKSRRSRCISRATNRRFMTGQLHLLDGGWTDMNLRSTKLLRCSTSRTTQTSIESYKALASPRRAAGRSDALAARRRNRGTRHLSHRQPAVHDHGLRAAFRPARSPRTTATTRTFRPGKRSWASCSRSCHFDSGWASGKWQCIEHIYSLSAQPSSGALV